jgi:hypothetical protein
MIPKILYLFPDTNLFAQCRALEELDWNRWGDFSEVNLIVSRPVQAEIDHQKNKGGERLAKRAKAASSLLREIILGSSDHKLVKDASPTVKLFIKTALKPNPALSDQLDYELNDDQLVGIVHGFAGDHPGHDVRVLTHDTGPMASAKMVGVEIAPIPDEWLLPPETSDKDKAIKALEAKVKRLEASEPIIQIGLTDAGGKAVKALEGERTVYEPLTAAEIEELVTRIKHRFPMVTDFSPPPKPMQAFSSQALLGFEQTYEAPTEKEITKYQTELYPKWHSDCRAVFKKLHNVALHPLIGRLRPDGSFGSSRKADCVGKSPFRRSNRAPNITARRKSGQWRKFTTSGDLAEACHFGLDICISIRVSMPCLLGESDETRPIWPADPTPSRSPRVSAFITVNLGDTSCPLNPARLVSLF